MTDGKMKPRSSKLNSTDFRKFKIPILVGTRFLIGMLDKCVDPNLNAMLGFE
jgi:hypothetical protein